jgi:hypothetical protein
MKPFALALAAVLAAAPAALAQPSGAGDSAAPTSSQTAIARPAFLHVRDTPEIIDQDRKSEALNAEVNRKNAEVQASNDAAKKAYEVQLADYQAATAAQRRAQADYEAKLKAIQAGAERAQADFEKAQTDWKKRADACKAGDRAACGP